MIKDTPKDSTNFDVIGIGNAIVDVLIQTNESTIKKLSLKKGCMTLIDELTAQNLYKEFKPSLITSGGSAANTLACIAQLGGECGFIGRVKNDGLGKIFAAQIRSVGTTFNTPPSSDGPSTARCLIFVTPDAQRTMCTYLGASVFLEPKDLSLEIIRKSKVLYLEGYLWDQPLAKNAFITAAKESREASKNIALSLSDSFCVLRHRESFLDLIENYVDILFANESEIKALYQTNSLDDAIKQIQSICETVAITLGEKGSILLTQKEQVKIEAYNFGTLIDTTGAGDLYAGGFLKGFTQGLNLYQCGEMGSICAGHIVTQLGSRSDVSLSKLIKEN